MARLCLSSRERHIKMEMSEPRLTLVQDRLDDFFHMVMRMLALEWGKAGVRMFALDVEHFITELGSFSCNTTMDL